MSTVAWIVLVMVSDMEALGIETIISLALAGLTLIVTFIGHYFYVRGKLHKAAAGAITNAEQESKTGDEKLELAVDQVYGLVPSALKVFIHRSSVRKIVQAAFDKIEDYAKKQVDKNSTTTEDVGNVRAQSDANENLSQTGDAEVCEQTASNLGESVQAQPSDPISWYLI